MQYFGSEIGESRVIMGDSREVEKPERLTLGVIFYNQEAFAEQAVQGALAQTYSPLEIIFSDDASTDNTFEVIQGAVEGYDGPHTVVLNRNRKNLGLAGNVNRVMELATGEIILHTGGDDISMPDRAARAAEVLEAEGDCVCVSFRTILFEGADIPSDIKPQANADDVACTRYTRHEYTATPFFHLNGASRAFRRRAFDVFGPIDPVCPTEDSVMLLRCILLGDVLEASDPQLYYRVHEGALSQFDNKYRFDRTEIHRQYLRDIAVAVRNGLLTDDEHEQLIAMLEQRLEQRTLQQRLHYAPNRLAVLRIIAKSKAYRGRRKGRLLVGALRPWKRY